MNKLRIMVVDDIEQNRYLLRYLLQGEGAQVSEAEHGRQALEQLRERPHDLIISDILMPVMDGYQLCCTCKKDPDLKEIPFVFYSATYTTEQDKKLALELGANRFFVKPLQSKELLRELRQLLAEQRAGNLTACVPRLDDDAELLQRYNSRLVRKLEDKLEQLERTNRELEEANARLESMAEQLAQAQKMEAIGTLVSGVAHNFNNVLFGILGKSYIARNKLGKDDAAVRRQIEEIESLVDHAANIVKQLMDYARKKAASNDIFPLETLVKETVATSKLGIPSHTTVRFHDQGEHLPVCGDATQIQQVVMNLMNNARDAVATADARWIDVTLRRHTVTDDGEEGDIKPGEWAHLTVADSGCGIGAEEISRVFDPFFTTKEDGKGTGLGLSTVHAIVQQHGGTITCHSAPGEGARFDIHLPLASESGEQPEAEQPLRLMRGNGEKILLAEDDDAIRKTMTDLLKMIGYRVVAVGNGREALELARQDHEIALVLTDMVMPEMGGVELVQALIDHGIDVPIVLASGYALDMDLLSEAAKARTRFLSKPYHAIPVSILLNSLLTES